MVGDHDYEHASNVYDVNDASNDYDANERGDYDYEYDHNDWASQNDNAEYSDASNSQKDNTDHNGGNEKTKDGDDYDQTGYDNDDQVGYEYDDEREVGQRGLPDASYDDMGKSNGDNKNHKNHANNEGICHANDKSHTGSHANDKNHASGHANNKESSHEDKNDDKKMMMEDEDDWGECGMSEVVQTRPMVNMDHHKVCTQDLATDGSLPSLLDPGCDADAEDNCSSTDTDESSKQDI